MAERETRPITPAEIEAFDARFTAWPDSLSDRERLILGATLWAAFATNDVGGYQTPAIMTPASTVGTIIASPLLSIAAILDVMAAVMTQQHEAQAELKVKGRPGP